MQIEMLSPKGSRYTIAKYIRLSMDDAKTDSMSVETQRDILDAHIATLGIPGAAVLEFIDNGHSGTNFERPAVQQLLELVRQGQVNCIMVKDFSRFGRNAIETGYFIERVFPLFGTRFIAVTDSFDSANHEGGTGGIEVAFKFIMHEEYSRDLSRKIKAAKHEKMLRGEFVTKNCIFGYKLDSDRKMVIDEPAAETVRMIFSLALDGNGVSEIARRLQEEKRPTPSQYKNSTRQTSVWGESVVHCILRDEQYIGTYVSGKLRTPEVGSKRQVKVPEREWFRIPGHHPAIVEPEVFVAVQKRFPKRTPRKRECRPRAVRQSTNAVDAAGLLSSFDKQAEREKLLAQTLAEKQRLFERFVLGEIGINEYKAAVDAITTQIR